MNDNQEPNQNAYRSFLLMSEIDKEEPLSQRELAQRLGIALGLVNSYLKNLVAKGFVRVKSFPRNRYAYLLTPKGVAEKSRLAYQHLNYFTGLYTVTRQDYRDLFLSLNAAGVSKIGFCGIDEVAEIAYLSLQETSIRLATVMDDEQTGSTFFHQPVLPLSEGVKSGLPVVITSLKKKDALHRELLRLGVGENGIHIVGTSNR